MTVLAMILIATEPAIVLHEWGVVLYDVGTARATGDPGALYDVEEAVAYAPVINLYGPDFTGEVSVAALGRIFEIHPEPDVSGGPMMMAGLGSFIRWEGIEARESEEGEVFEPVPGLMAAPLWRPEEALTLTRADGFRDRFLYYEVDLAGTEFPLPLAGLSPRGIPTAGEVILLHRGAAGVDCYELLPRGDLSLAGGSAPFLYSCSGVTAVLERWAGTTLSESELSAMWATWEPYVRSGDWDGSSLAVFRLPDEVVGLVSTVNAVSDQGHPVSVQRFFLGMLAIP